MAAEIVYPPYIENCSILIGKLRDIANAETDWDEIQFRGGSKSAHTNVLGVKAELIAQHFAFSRGVKYSATRLLAETPQSEPDIIIGDKHYDVKSIRPDAPDLLVNVRNHKKPKSVTHYWFIQCLGSCRARFWFYAHDEVNDWPKKMCGDTEAYYQRIADIERGAAA